MPNTAFRAALTRDAATFLGDFGETVTNGSATATGVVRVVDEPEDNGNGFVVMQRRTWLRLVTGTGGTIADGTMLTIGTVTYRVDGDGVPVPPDGRHTDYRLVGAP